MSNKQKLSKTRQNTVINTTSSVQEKEEVQARKKVVARLQLKYPNITLDFGKNLTNKDIVEYLRKAFTDQKFFYHTDKSFISPDGGILYIKDKAGKKYPILIPEAKNQGTNDEREKNGQEKQAMGNAIERLGKNVIVLRAFLSKEDIFPFICFGYGCDFCATSTILDRVSGIALYGKLNKIHLRDEGPFKRGSFFFREKKWSIKEMTRIMYEIAEGSIKYYFEKYGEDNFQ